MGNHGSTVVEEKEEDVKTMTEDERKLNEHWETLKRRADAFQKYYHKEVEGLVGPITTTNLQLVQESMLMFSQEEENLPGLVSFVEKNVHALHEAVEKFAKIDGSLCVDMATLTPMYALFINMALAIMNRNNYTGLKENMHIIVKDADVSVKQLNEWSWIITAAASFNTHSRVKIYYAKGTDAGVKRLHDMLKGLGLQITLAHHKHGKPAAVSFYETIMNIHPEDAVTVQQMALELHVQMMTNKKMLDIDFHVKPYEITDEFKAATGFKPVEREPDAKNEDISRLAASVTAFLQMNKCNGKSYSSSSSSSSSSRLPHAHHYSRRGHPHPHAPKVPTHLGKMACRADMAKINGSPEMDVLMNWNVYLKSASNAVNQYISTYGLKAINEQTVPEDVMRNILKIEDNVIEILEYMNNKNTDSFRPSSIKEFYSLIKSIPRQVLVVNFYDELIEKYDENLRDFENKYAAYIS